MEEMSTHVKSLVAASKTPTQLADAGAKITYPLAAIAALRNLSDLLMVDEMSMQLKALSVVLKTPTQLAC